MGLQLKLPELLLEDVSSSSSMKKKRKSSEMMIGCDIMQILSKYISYPLRRKSFVETVTSTVKSCSHKALSDIIILCLQLF